MEIETSLSLLLCSKLDFLTSDIMLGEGNVLAHLVIVGYKVSHLQVSISYHVDCYLQKRPCSCVSDFAQMCTCFLQWDKLMTRSEVC